jgi:hypothetical protein
MTLLETPRQEENVAIEKRFSLMALLHTVHYHTPKVFNVL